MFLCDTMYIIIGHPRFLLSVPYLWTWYKIYLMKYQRNVILKFKSVIFKKILNKYIFDFLLVSLILIKV